LLDVDAVQRFIGTEKYEQRKQQRFPKADELRISKNLAFLFENTEEFNQFEKEYKATAALYYAGQPSLSEIAEKSKAHIDKL
jgi:hypothetical protein